MEIESQLEAVTNHTQTKLQTAFGVLKKDQQNMSFYRLNALPQSELLLKNSQRSFQEGEIEYVEYVQGLNRALAIQTKYLGFVNQYNQTLILIEKLISKN
jgi:cobalt-zinc-cadmium resistance protein CzcA